LFDFSKRAQEVWATDSIADKKDLLLDMVNNFMYKGKYDEIANRFIRNIQTAKSKQRLDDMAAQLALNNDMKVI
tara:strand:+ start:56 stop:277 length:222 start_codon:yes stop_codon:yes gene_type:complete